MRTAHAAFTASGDAEILIIYQKEPHAGQMAFRDIAQPESLPERMTLARRMKDEYELPMTVLVDTMEDQSRALFSDLPSPAFVIDGAGVVRAKFPWAEGEQIAAAVEEVRRGPPPAPRPNILLIVADDMGYGDLGCYGSTQIATPHLDALARGGVRFTDGYVSAPVCAPSRAGLLTGRYQERFGFEHNLSTPEHVKAEHVGIPLDEVLVSDRLKGLGYRTGLVGKWHVGQATPEHRPNARGFDSFFGMLVGSHGYWPKPGKNRLWGDTEPVTEIRTPYLTDWFTLEARDFVTAGGDEPWFLFLSYNTPHTPMEAKDEDLARYAHITPERRRTYCAMQHNMDENIGRLVEALRESGQLEDTLIVFMSDNGGSVTSSSAINAPLNGMKGTFLEGGIRVPLLMHWPAGLAAGRVCTEPIISLDLAPTFMGLAGGAIEEETVGAGKRARVRRRDGVDLMPHLRGQAPSPPHDTLYWRMALRGSAVRRGDWKLIQTPHHPTMLFNLAEDLSEQNNLAAVHPDKVAELTRAFADWSEGLAANPMWISAPRWSRYNRRLYDQEYEVVQPSGDAARH